MPRPFTTITPRIFSVSLIKLTRVLVDSRSERGFAWRFVPSVTGRLLPGTAAQLVCFNSLRKRKKEKRKTWKKGKNAEFERVGERCKEIVRKEREEEIVGNKKRKGGRKGVSEGANEWMNEGGESAKGKSEKRNGKDSYWKRKSYKGAKIPPPSVCLYICPSLCLSICPSLCLYIYLDVYTYTYTCIHI